MAELYFVLTKPDAAHISLHDFFMRFILFKVMNSFFRN